MSPVTYWVFLFLPHHFDGMRCISSGVIRMLMLFLNERSKAQNHERIARESDACLSSTRWNLELL